ncbi:tetratricopeptide repeat protein [Catenulispora rubra]|uniref:tetratricopeptide repeat protein n=1 Tax=Catenulispora rubra TaxID=280293 RepID=UPI0018922F1D|nr:tetratricopeptide repeat protein [Catenulispora rubra]
MHRNERDHSIPAALIERPEFIAACQRHDISTVFALAERYGLSRSAISRQTEIKTDHVREIINGRRAVESFAVYERIADGLRIPGTMLGLSPRSWETVAVDQQGSHEDELQPWQLADALTRSSVSPIALDQMERAAMKLAGMYPSTPPEQLMPQVLGLSGRVHEVLSLPSSLIVKRRSVQVAGILAGLAGHIYLDLGDRDRSASFYEVGRVAGEEAEDDGLIAWALTMQSIGQFFEGDPAAAVEYLEEAARLTEGGTNRRRHAWVSAQLARAYATDGDSNAALQALEQASSSFEGADEAGGIDFFDEARLSGIAGTCNLLIGQPAAASEILADALNHRAVEDQKGRSLLTFDLASCLIDTGEIEEACNMASTALNVASGSIVQPIAIRARALRQELQPWSELGSVQAFGEHLRAQLSSTAALEG